MFRTWMAANPIDLIEPGTAESLDLLRGAVGVDGLVLWVAAPPARYFRPRAEGGRVLHFEGGLAYRADPAAFAATRLKPPASATRSRDILEDLSGACAERQMGLSVALSATQTGGLARRHPEAACKNAFGDVSTTSLCLVNPDVRAWLRALVEDVTSRFELEAVFLHDLRLGCADAASIDLAAPVEHRAMIRALLARCFCESCRQRATTAGQDAEASANWVRASIERLLDSSPASEQALSDVHRRRPARQSGASDEDLLDDVLAEVARASRCPVILGQPDGSEPVIRVTQSTSIAGHLVGLSSGLVPDRECLVGNVTHLAIDATDAVMGDPAGLVSLFKSLAEHGWQGVVVRHFGQLPHAALEALRQAIRFARRATAEVGE